MGNLFKNKNTAVNSDDVEDKDQNDNGNSNLMSLLNGTTPTTDSTGTSSIPDSKAPPSDNSGGDTSDAPPTSTGDDIKVVASNKRQIHPDDRDQPSNNAMQELVQRKGMFGIHGTLRNVLGVLGDAFLSQAHLPDAYAPRRREEKMGSALYDIASNPMAAVNRLAANGYGSEAQELYGTVAANQARAAMNQTLGEQRGVATQEKVNRQVSGLLGGAKNSADYAARYKVAQGIADRAKVDLNDLGFSPEYSEDNVSMAHDLGQSSYQQDRIQQGQTAEEGRNNRSASSISAANDRAAAWRQTYTQTHQPRPGPQPTNAAMAKPLLDKLKSGQSLTPGEESVLKRMGYSATRGDKKGTILDQLRNNTNPSSSNAPAQSAPNPFKEGSTVYRNGHQYTVKNGKAYLVK